MTDEGFEWLLVQVAGEALHWLCVVPANQNTNTCLKGPKHEIFESGFFTQIRPVRLDDLGTGEKI